MYNLNVNVASSASGAGNLLGVETPCTTPKTPEILNSLIAMTNPFDGYSTQGPRLRIASCPPDASSSSSSASSCSPDSPPSVQHTCSQLIKEGLKLTIQTKRRNTGRHLETLESPRNKMSRREEVSPDDDLFSPGARLTAEDEERRRRRRERNKIAATKCRLKKRERTVNLVQESEVLENQNHDLKSQIQELETQRRRLMDMLSMHSPTCMKNNANNSNNGSSPTNNPHLPYSPESHQAAPPVSYDTSQMVASGPTATFCGVLDTSNGIPTSGYHHFSVFTGGYSTTSGVDSGCMA